MDDNTTVTTYTGLPLLEDEISYVSMLPDEPNDTGGYSANELKAWFDKAGNRIKRFLNEEFIPFLRGEHGARNIGISTVPGMEGVDNVQAGFELVQLQMLELSQGSVANEAVTTPKLADKAVTTPKLADKAVTTPKLADKAVTTINIGDSAVGTEQIGSFAVTAEKIKDGVVSAQKIADAAKTQRWTVLMPIVWEGSTAPYSAEVSVQGVLASDIPELFFVPPANFNVIEAWEVEYSKLYDIYAAGDDTLLFKAKEPLTIGISVVVEAARI